MNYNCLNSHVRIQKQFIFKLVYICGLVDSNCIDITQTYSIKLEQNQISTLAPSPCSFGITKLLKIVSVLLFVVLYIAA